MSKLNVHNEETNNGCVYFELEGMLDAHNFETLEALFERYFETGVHRFVVDIRRLEYVSSAGAGVFIGAVGTCQDNNGNIVLVQPSQEVKEILEMLGVFQIFPVVQNRAQAIEAFSGSVPS
jgi:anti-sigma B factor antagonist